MWVIGRTVTYSPRDLPRALKVMRRYELTPLSRLGRPVGRRGSRAPGRPRKAPLPRDALKFLAALNTALARNPPPKRDAPILRRLARYGVGPGLSPRRAGLSPVALTGLREGVEREAAELPTRARADVLRRALAGGGWYSPDSNIGAYGTDYGSRALIALVGLGANTREEATYPIALADSAGGILLCARRYRITFRPGRTPPVRAFWSLTMYDLAGYLVPNAAKRYAVGDTHPPLRKKPDGSVVVVVQRAKPTESRVNWLPAPEGAFRLNLRLYWPRRSALSGAWKPPPVVRVDP